MWYFLRGGEGLAQWRMLTQSFVKKWSSCRLFTPFLAWISVRNCWLRVLLLWITLNLSILGTAHKIRSLIWSQTWLGNDSCPVLHWSVECDLSGFRSLKASSMDLCQPECCAFPDSLAIGIMWRPAVGKVLSGLRKLFTAACMRFSFVGQPPVCLFEAHNGQVAVLLVACG